MKFILFEYKFYYYSVILFFIISVFINDFVYLINYYLFLFYLKYIISLALINVYCL